MVVRQYKAKGPLVDLLLPIVALDDAVGLVVFAVSFGIAKALNTNSFDIISIVVDPLFEIVCSLVLGAFGVPQENFAVDLTIARGLDYYTGTVYETMINSHPEIGSVCSGGRYDLSLIHI